MERQPLPEDFKDFLRLLNENSVEYLVIGGYAVSYHGYPRATLDMDVWVGISEDNAQKMVRVMEAFGFVSGEVSPQLFLSDNSMIRMGVPPMRLEVLTGISGVQFEDCYRNRVVDAVGGVEISVIGLQDLRKNKRASGRLKDLADLQYLPATGSRRGGGEDGQQ